MTLQLTIKSELKLEFAFGKVTQGKEMQVFGEYFPAVAPLFAEYGCQQVGSFAILASNITGIAPEMGSFTHWSSAESFKRFYSDPRFIKVKALRDDALDLLSDGHFFSSLDKVIEVRTDVDYAIIISKEETTDLIPIFTLPLESNSPKQTYSGKSITFSLWNDNAAKLLAAPSTEDEVFRVRFNAPA